MKTKFYFFVELPETGVALGWCGGGLKKSAKHTHVWLTSPNGQRVLEVERRHVAPSTREQTARRIAEDRRARREHGN